MIETNSSDVYPGDQSHRLSCRVDGCTVIIAGEVDQDTAQTVARAVFYADITGDVDVDLSAVTSADSALLHLLLDMQRSLRHDGGTVRIVRASETVSKLIDVSWTADASTATCRPHDDVAAPVGTAMS